jgi:energy-converting hydrogenase Eha subunit E
LIVYVEKDPDDPPKQLVTRERMTVQQVKSIIGEGSTAFTLNKNQQRYSFGLTGAMIWLHSISGKQKPAEIFSSVDGADAEVNVVCVVYIFCGSDLIVYVEKDPDDPPKQLVMRERMTVQQVKSIIGEGSTAFTVNKNQQRYSFGLTGAMIWLHSISGKQKPAEIFPSVDGADAEVNVVCVLYIFCVNEDVLSLLQHILKQRKGED